MRESTLRELTLRLKNAAPTLQLEENADMARYTTLHLGGPADLMANPDDPAQIPLLIETARELDVPVTVIGNGSNLLVRSGGIRGLVIRICRNLRGVEVNGDRIRAQAGTMMSSLSMAAADCDLGGLTFASGIPGTIGGGVYMNAGAYGGEVSQVLKESTYYDTKSRSVCTIPLSEHKYGYRESVYRDCPERPILSAVFELNVGDKKQIKEKMDGFMESRRTKQPLEYPSAGSVFKRCQGHFTGQMIEELGLKGYTVGGAQISEKHAGFIINKGGASSEDVLKLIAFIQNKVHDGYGLDLECEVIHVK